MKVTERVFLDLILYKAWAGLRAEAARNYLSFLWWVIEPLLFMAVFYVVFGVLLDRGTEGFVPFLLVGIVSWQWFSNSIKHAMTSIHGGGRLMTQVHLPKAFFPAVVVVMDAAKSLVVLALLLVFLMLSGYAPGVSYLALPLVLAVQLLLISACALVAAMVIPLLPDLRFAVDALLQLMFFVSGVFFSGEMLRPEHQPYFYANPVANLIEAYRDILLHGTWPDFSVLGWIGLFSLLSLGVANLLLMRVDHSEN